MMLKPTNYIIDFDSTIIRCESLDELARIALRNKADHEDTMITLERLTIDAMDGKIAFDEALRQRLALFQATREHVNELTQFLHGQITTSLKNDMTWFNANSDRIYVVSGGFEDYIKPVVALLGIAPERVFANRFTYDDAGDVTGYDHTSLLSRQGGKVDQVVSMKLSGPVIMIGDGYTDYEVKAHKAADEFWAFTENVHRGRVTENADRIIETFPTVAPKLVLVS
ncbi:MAG: 3-phosphoglycerate dehydrogenase [Candidatus Saccharibacteria bacterium]|nr:3-phosphoglycerate dehydrogenase [Candidatus Saccharibacteria bacterium]